MDSSLVRSEESLTTTVTKELELGILPHMIGYEEKAIKKLLLAKKNTYYNELHGIMLRFEEPILLEQSGRIIDDNPLMYWRISAEFSVFSVAPRQLVVTKVASIEPNNIRAKLVGCLNVNIRLDPSLPPEEQAFCQSFKADDQIVFRVQSLVLAEMSISGVVDEVCMAQMHLLYGF